MLALLGAVLLVLGALVHQSAQGAITEVQARHLVPPILLLKLFLILPEMALNVCGTLWAFCPDLVQCPYEGHFSRTVIEGEAQWTGSQPGALILVHIEANFLKKNESFVEKKQKLYDENREIDFQKNGMKRHGETVAPVCARL